MWLSKERGARNDRQIYHVSQQGLEGETEARPAPVNLPALGQDWLYCREGAQAVSLKPDSLDLPVLSFSECVCVCMCVCVCVHAQLCQTLATPWMVTHQAPWNFPGKYTCWGCHSLLQGIFPTQGLNPFPVLVGGFFLPQSQLGSDNYNRSFHAIPPSLNTHKHTRTHILLRLLILINFNNMFSFLWRVAMNWLSRKKTVGFPDSSVGKESSCNAGDPSSTPGLGRSPGEGKGYPLQYSGLENSMD